MKNKQEYNELECYCTPGGFVKADPFKVYSEIWGIAIATDKEYGMLYLDLIPGAGNWQRFPYVLDKEGKRMFKTVMGVTNTKDLEGMVVFLVRDRKKHTIKGIAPFENNVIGIEKKKGLQGPLNKIRGIINEELKDIENGSEDYKRDDEDQNWGFMGKVD